MKPYPRYKPTGLAWLPSVPEHWEVRQLKRMADLKGGAGFPVEKQGRFNNQIRFIKVNSLASKIDPARDYDTVSDSDIAELNADVFPQGSIVFAKVGAALLLHRFELLPFDSCIDNNMMAIYNISENPEWLRYALSILDFRYLVNPGAVPSVNQSQVGTMLLPVPPPDEQERIVHYLDEKTAAIDELVRAKERQIELLRERKQALVSAAMTRGLDPATKLKDSGDPFTGSVPHNWKATPLHSCSRVVSKRGDPQSELLSVFLNLGVVRFSDMGEKRANATSLDLTNYQEVKPGNLVLNNQQAWRGSVGVSKLSGIVSPAYVVVELDDSWDTDFANYFFRAPHMVAHYVVASKGVGSIQRIIDWNEMKHLKVFRPDKAEQKQIADQLGLACKRFDDLEAACLKQIALLQELRTRLVSDAVTGAVEVK